MRLTTTDLGYRDIVRDVDLEIGSGEMVALVGANGAGKTTLLRLLAGLLTPTRGKVMLTDSRGGRPPDLARFRSYLSPTPPDDINFTVREVVEMGRHPWTAEARDAGEAVDRAIGSLGLGSLGNKPYSTLSTGEARRVQLARVLAQETQLLVLDEVTGGLDIGGAARALEVLRSRATEGAAVLGVVHDLTSAARFFDRVCLMAEGELIADGPPSHVLQDRLLSRAFGSSLRVVDVDGHPVVWPD